MHFITFPLVVYIFAKKSSFLPEYFDRSIRLNLIFHVFFIAVSLHGMWHCALHRCVARPLTVSTVYLGKKCLSLVISQLILKLILYKR